jgi:hypothetical protein
MNVYGTFEVGNQGPTPDVCFSDGQARQVIAEPPSELVAVLLAHALNRVVNRFLDCGSDRETAAFAEALDDLIGE